MLLLSNFFCDLLSFYVESFPNVSEMKDYVASGAGYLQGGLQRENWERATLSIVKTTSKTAMHPGINFFIKHAGAIFRNLFQVALKDISNLPETKHLFDICPSMESFVTNKFDDMVWALMENAAATTHLAIEPYYSCLDPNLPNFRPPEQDSDNEDEEEVDLNVSLMSRLWSMARKKLDDAATKELLRQRGKERASEKRKFLAEKRASMINDEETDEIIKSAFQYLLSLHEFIETILNFQTNYCLYNAFKAELESFSRVVSDSDWTEMLPNDDSLDAMIDELDDKIDGLKGSLDSVNKMQMKF